MTRNRIRSSPAGGDCAVCLSELSFPAARMPCFHVLHRDCLRDFVRWQAGDRRREAEEEASRQLVGPRWHSWARPVTVRQQPPFQAGLPSGPQHGRGGRGDIPLPGMPPGLCGGRTACTRGLAGRKGEARPGPTRPAGERRGRELSRVRITHGLPLPPQAHAAPVPEDLRADLLALQSRFGAILDRQQKAGGLFEKRTIVIDENTRLERTAPPPPDGPPAPPASSGEGQVKGRGSGRGRGPGGSQKVTPTEAAGDGPRQPSGRAGRRAAAGLPPLDALHVTDRPQSTRGRGRGGRSTDLSGR